MDNDIKNLIDTNNKLFEAKLFSTQNGVDEAIKRFERSYDIILKENEKTNKSLDKTNEKLDQILSQHVEYTKDIALNRYDIEAGKSNMICVTEKIDSMDVYLREVVDKMGNIPLKIGTVFMILVAVAGAALKFFPEKGQIYDKNKVKKVKQIR